MSVTPKDLGYLMKQLTQVRTSILKEFPFFGRLLLNMPLAFANVQTACTDMKNIIFDPAFLSRLNMEEIKFLMLHELYHCVLRHCTRGKEYIPLIHNIACDIVVNSLILESMQLDTFQLDNEEVMHLTPLGTEGRLYTVEQIYKMLMNQPKDVGHSSPFSGSTDNHQSWGMLSDSDKHTLDSIWNHRIQKVAKSCSEYGTGIPGHLERHLAEISHHPHTNWRQILHDFIQNDRFDYTFVNPDKRFSTYDFILPSFQENIDGECVQKLWFLIDTSGSISNKGIAEATYEIADAMEQIEHLSGWLSYFDTEVSEPVPFESTEELLAQKPIGGGGTRFSSIFKTMPDYFPDELPAMVLILTDGYSRVPNESVSKGVPVLWVIIDSDVDPGWGTVIHIDT